LNKRLNINESFISRIWEGNELYFSNLKTIGNEPVEIIHIGKRNSDAGPDYKDAKIKIGPTLFIGDVEIHRDFSNWEDHSHRKDRKYNSVILQVVMWDSVTRTNPKLRIKRHLPTVILSDYLNTSIHNIWQDIINNPSDNFKLACINENQSIPDDELKEMLSGLSMDRLKIKSARIKDRLREIEHDERGSVTGHYLKTSALWKQVLYEFVFEALGFSKNKEPMLKLASGLTLKNINKILDKPEISSDGTTILIQSLLFGAGGFFFDLRNKDKYIDEIKNIWSKLNPKKGKEQVSRSEWNFFRLRPANFPTIRLAYGSQLILKIIKEDFLKKVILVYQNNNFDVKSAFKELEGLFKPQYDQYWSQHYTFGKQAKSVFTLLGKQRINDIIINVVIPFVYLYSTIFDKKLMNKNVLTFYNNLKIKPDNSVLKVIDRQILNNRNIKINSPAMEQASIQLYNFFCTRERCNECEIGKQVFKDKGYEYKIIFY